MLKAIKYALPLTLALFAAPVSAATFSSCTYGLDAKVSGAADCAISGDITTDDEGVVNAAGFFHTTDWAFLGTVDDMKAGKGRGKSGTYDLGSLAKLGYEEIMLVFKSGKKTTVVGYLLDLTTDLTGSWSTPFTNMPFDFGKFADKNTWHISVYASGTPSAVPLPAGGALLLSGLAGAALLRRRKKA